MYSVEGEGDGGCIAGERISRAAVW